VGKKRPERAARRMEERALRKVVRDREKLAGLEKGGSPEHPIEVESVAVIEVRAHAMPCHQCESEVRVGEQTVDFERGLRVLELGCTRCAAKRTLWFRIVANEPN
jgi:hypothetical protein